MNVRERGTELVIMRMPAAALLAAALAAAPILGSDGLEARPLSPDVYLTGCEEVPVLLRPGCEFAAEKFVQDFQRALQRSYWAQRDVALCLRTGCDGAVRIEPVAACAWRQVLARGGFERYSPGDHAELETDCGSLDPDERAAAEDKADTISGHMEAAGALTRAD
jgi:hypothetical protein